MHDGVEGSHTSLPASEKEWAIVDLPSIDDRMNEQPDINTVSIEPTDLYQLIKKAILEVCDSHFRDSLPSRRIKQSYTAAATSFVIVVRESWWLVC